LVEARARFGHGSPQRRVEAERLGRIAWRQRQLAHLRQSESNAANYRVASAGFLAEVDRMQRDVREYLSIQPTELACVA
jgi:hypothetical protein